MTIKAIVFDLGGVIIELDFSKFFKEVIEVSPINKPNAFLLLEFWRQSDVYHQGKISNEEFYHLACEILQTCAQSQEEFFKSFNSVLDHLNEDIIRLIKRLRDMEKYKLILLSNINSSHWNFLLEKNWKFINYFDDSVLSHQVHLTKPDPKIFSLTLYKADCKPEEMLYIDDGLNNVLAARELLINSIRFAGYDSLIEEFKKYKIL
jgi:putative hydrolase of the HAD superfamily